MTSKLLLCLSTVDLFIIIDVIIESVVSSYTFKMVTWVSIPDLFFPIFIDAHPIALYRPEHPEYLVFVFPIEYSRF